MDQHNDLEKYNRTNFRSSLEALSRPGKYQVIHPVFGSGLLAMASVLLFAEVSYCYQGEKDFSIIEALSGSKQAPVEDADYIFLDGPDTQTIQEAKPGTADRPENSATLICSCESSTQIRTKLSGPGINGSTTTNLPVDEPFITALAEINCAFPMGIDIFLVVDNHKILGLPRTTTIEVIA